MMRGAGLLRWARGVYMEWWSKRHDANREPPDEMLARVYLQGAIDALREEIESKQGGAKP